LARAPHEGGSLKTWSIRIAQLALTVLVTWFVVDRVGLDWTEFQQLDLAAWQPHPIALAASCALLLLAMFMNAALWARVVRDLGGAHIPVKQAIPLFMIANLGRYVPGKVWQIAGLAALASARGVRAITATGAALLGQGFSVLAATAIGLGALLTGPESVRPFGLGAAGLLALVVLFIAIPTSFRAGARLWFRLARTEAPPQLDSVHGLQWLALYALNWVVLALSFWVLVASFGVSAPIVPVASAFAAAYVVGYLFIPAPAGLGIRESFLIAFLTPHVGVGSAGALAVIARIWTTVVELVPAAVFWIRHVTAKEADEGARHG
jgi:uncharacterized membrane protein YbhN (UPF0104 family)